MQTWKLKERLIQIPLPLPHIFPSLWCLACFILTDEHITGNPNSSLIHSSQQHDTHLGFPFWLCPSAGLSEARQGNGQQLHEHFWSTTFDTPACTLQLPSSLKKQAMRACNFFSLGHKRKSWGLRCPHQDHTIGLGSIWSRVQVHIAKPCPHKHHLLPSPTRWKRGGVRGLDMATTPQFLSF